MPKRPQIWVILLGLRSSVMLSGISWYFFYRRFRTTHGNCNGQAVGEGFFLDCFGLADVTDRLSRNVAKTTDLLRATFHTSDGSLKSRVHVVNVLLNLSFILIIAMKIVVLEMNCLLSLKD